MGSMTTAAKKQRKAMEVELLAELRRIGPEDLHAAPVVERFIRKGVPRATAWRWAKKVLAGSGPAKALVEEVARVQRPKAPKPPEEPETKQKTKRAKVSATGALEVMPVLARADEAIVPGGGIAAMAEKLSYCIQNAEQVAEFARTPEGAVRNSKLLLQASEHLRRSLDTAIRLQSAIVEMSNVREFNRQIYETVKAMQPLAAAEMLTRLRACHESWSYLDPGPT